MRCKTRDHAKHGITLEHGILGRSRNRAEQNPSQRTAWTTPEENHRPGRDRMQRPSTALQKGLTFPGPALCLRCLARSSPSLRAIGGAAGPASPITLNSTVPTEYGRDVGQQSQPESYASQLFLLCYSYLRNF